MALGGASGTAAAVCSVSSDLFLEVHWPQLVVSPHLLAAHLCICMDVFCFVVFSSLLAHILFSRSRPAMAGKNYYLMTSFPSKEIGDESATLAQANLLNSVVMQRMR